MELLLAIAFAAGIALVGGVIANSISNVKENIRGEYLDEKAEERRSKYVSEINVGDEVKAFSPDVNLKYVKPGVVVGIDGDDVSVMYTDENGNCLGIVKYDYNEVIIL